MPTIFVHRKRIDTPGFAPAELPESTRSAETRRVGLSRNRPGRRATEEERFVNSRGEQSEARCVIREISYLFVLIKFYDYRQSSLTAGRTGTFRSGSYGTPHL